MRDAAFFLLTLVAPACIPPDLPAQACRTVLMRCFLERSDPAVPVRNPPGWRW